MGRADPVVTKRGGYGEADTCGEETRGLREGKKENFQELFLINKHPYRMVCLLHRLLSPPGRVVRNSTFFWEFKQWEMTRKEFFSNCFSNHLS